MTKTLPTQQQVNQKDVLYEAQKHQKGMMVLQKHLETLSAHRETLRDIIKGMSKGTYDYQSLAPNLLPHDKKEAHTRIAKQAMPRAIAGVTPKKVNERAVSIESASERCTLAYGEIIELQSFVTENRELVLQELDGWQKVPNRAAAILNATFVKYT